MNPYPRARVDLAALRHNFQRVRAAAPGCRIMAVVKADAYGHGVEQVVGALEAADAFAVARLGEAMQLRTLGCSKPLVLLEGCADGSDLQQAIACGLQPVVHRPAQLEMLESAESRAPIACWLKVDTGMHRLGFAAGDALAAYWRLLAAPGVGGRPGLMTHLADADQLDDEATEKQLACFAPLAAATGASTSVANSAGILGWPASHGAWVRPGLMLYGASPFARGRATEHQLHPAMTFSSRLIAVNRYRRGDRIGYGGTWVCPEDMPVGVVAVGYGDGYPRHAPSGTPVLLRGRRVPLVGRVSMDMISIDLRQCREAKPGDEVVLWGEGLAVEEIAEAAGTIAYQLFCGVTGRVKFEFVDQPARSRAAGR